MSRAHVRIAALRPPDAAEFQALRLRALREDPDAFGSTYAEEVATPIATIAWRRVPLSPRVSSWEHGRIRAMNWSA